MTKKWRTHLLRRFRGTWRWPKRYCEDNRRKNGKKRSISVLLHRNRHLLDDIYIYNIHITFYIACGNCGKMEMKSSNGFLLLSVVKCYSHEQRIRLRDNHVIIFFIFHWLLFLYAIFGNHRECTDYTLCINSYSSWSGGVVAWWRGCVIKNDTLSIKPINTHTHAHTHRANCMLARN